MVRASSLPVNTLTVCELADTNSSVVYLNPNRINALSLFSGDAVQIHGSNGNSSSHVSETRTTTTICIVLPDDSCPKRGVKMNEVVRRNLQINLGDSVTVEPCEGIPFGKQIEVQPIRDTIMLITEEGTATTGEGENDLYSFQFLEPYFKDAYRPVCAGDHFICRYERHAVEFKVVRVDPSPYCIVDRKTIIRLADREPLVNTSRKYGKDAEHETQHAHIQMEEKEEAGQQSVTGEQKTETK